MTGQAFIQWTSNLFRAFAISLDICGYLGTLASANYFYLYIILLGMGYLSIPLVVFFVSIFACYLFQSLVGDWKAASCVNKRTCHPCSQYYGMIHHVCSGRDTPRDGSAEETSHSSLPNSDPPKEDIDFRIQDIVRQLSQLIDLERLEPIRQELEIRISNLERELQVTKDDTEAPATASPIPDQLARSNQQRNYVTFPPISVRPVNRGTRLSVHRTSIMAGERPVGRAVRRSLLFPMPAEADVPLEPSTVQPPALPEPVIAEGPQSGVDETQPDSNKHSLSTEGPEIITGEHTVLPGVPQFTSAISSSIDTKKLHMDEKKFGTGTGVFKDFPERSSTSYEELERVTEEPQIQHEEVLPPAEPQVQHKLYQPYVEEAQIQHGGLQLSADEPQVQHEESLIRFEETQVPLEDAQVQYKQPQLQYAEPQVQCQEPQIHHQEPPVQYQELQARHEEYRIHPENSQFQYQEPQFQHEEPKIQPEVSQLQPCQQSSIEYLYYRSSNSKGTPLTRAPISRPARRTVQKHPESTLSHPTILKRVKTWSNSMVRKSAATRIDRALSRGDSGLFSALERPIHHGILSMIHGMDPARFLPKTVEVETEILAEVVADVVGGFQTGSTEASVDLDSATPDLLGSRESSELSEILSDDDGTRRRDSLASVSTQAVSDEEDETTCEELLEMMNEASIGTVMTNHLDPKFRMLGVIQRALIQQLSTGLFKRRHIQVQLRRILRAHMDPSQFDRLNLLVQIDFYRRSIVAQYNNLCSMKEQIECSSEQHRTALQERTTALDMIRDTYETEARRLNRQPTVAGLRMMLEELSECHSRLSADPSLRHQVEEHNYPDCFNGEAEEAPAEFSEPADDIIGQINDLRISILKRLRRVNDFEDMECEDTAHHAIVADLKANLEKLFDRCERARLRLDGHQVDRDYETKEAEYLEELVAELKTSEKLQHQVPFCGLAEEDCKSVCSTDSESSSEEEDDDSEDSDDLISHKGSEEGSLDLSSSPQLRNVGYSVLPKLKSVRKRTRSSSASSSGKSDPAPFPQDCR